MAIANRTALGPDEVLVAPFLVNGEISETVYAGYFKVSGKAVYLAGIQAFYRLPPGTSGTSVRVSVVSADGARQAGTNLDLVGITNGKRQLFTPDVFLPPDSIWRLKVELLLGEPENLPANLELTYLYRYNPGPAPLAGHVVNEIPQVGIGFWAVDETFIVQ